MYHNVAPQSTCTTETLPQSTDAVHVIKVATWRDMRRKQTPQHSFNLILKKPAFYKREPPVLIYWKPRFTVNVNNCSNYPADQSSLKKSQYNCFLRMEMPDQSWHRDAWSKLTELQKKEEAASVSGGKTWVTILVSMLGKHNQKWKRN